MSGADVDSTGDMLAKIDSFNKGEIQVKCPDAQVDEAKKCRMPAHASTGTTFKFVCEPPGEDRKAHAMKRVNTLRNMKMRGCKLPNIQAKLQAVRVLD